MPGFDFSNYNRNLALQASGFKTPKSISTGTTIVGCIFEGGVVLAADTRSTFGEIVANKNCEKLHFISPQIWCAGAGTAADTEFTTAITSSNLELHSHYTNRKPRVITCMTMLKQYLFKYQGHIGAYLLVGGVDSTGPHLYSVHAHGSTDKVPFLTSGSGSLAAMAVFEKDWKPNMTEEEAVQMCSDGIEAGIWNDLGSGSNVDVVVIKENHTVLHRNMVKPNQRVQKEQNYTFRRGTTAVLDEKVTNRAQRVDLSSILDIQPLRDESQMDVDS